MSSSSPLPTAQASTVAGHPSGTRPPLTVARLLVKLYGLYDMPRAMSQLNPRQEQIELIFRPSVKYYYHDKRVAQLDLQEQCVAVSPASIMFKNDRFVLDFENPNTWRVMTHSTNFRNSLSEAHFAGVNLAANVEAAGTSSNNNNNNSNAAAVAPTAASTPGNILTLEFPSRVDLKVIVDILVCVRQRRIGSSAVRWMNLSNPEELRCSMFSASEGEVARHKIVNRFVGLPVGHLFCTVSLPHVEDDLRTLPDAKTRILDAVDRLELNHNLLHKYYSGYPNPANPPVTRKTFAERLMNGESEAAIYNEMRLQADPQLYVRRVQEVLANYPPSPQNTEFCNVTAETLLTQHVGHEERLIRHMSSELGPEVGSISPRTRRMVYRWYFDKSDEDLMDCIKDTYGLDRDLIDYEPNLFMSLVAKRYQPELKPSMYNFPLIKFSPDRRVSFGDCLRFPVNRGSTRYGDAALAARSKRPLMCLSPRERPLKGSKPGVNMSEIDILMEKYEPEFDQLVPAVLDAMDTVVKNHENLVGNMGEEALDKRFAIFEVRSPLFSYMHVLNSIARQTYISPSSLLGALIYLDRLCMRYASLLLTKTYMERLFVMAVRIANKVIDLRGINNKNFANAVGLNLEYFNKMEETLLKLLEFDLYLPPEEFYSYANLIVPNTFVQTRRSIVHGSGSLSIPVVVPPPPPLPVATASAATASRDEGLRAGKEANESAKRSEGGNHMHNNNNNNNNNITDSRCSDQVDVVDVDVVTTGTCRATHNTSPPLKAAVTATVMMNGGATARSAEENRSNRVMNASTGALPNLPQEFETYSDGMHDQSARIERYVSSFRSPAPPLPQPSPAQVPRGNSEKYPDSKWVRGYDAV